jgi:hypothetical protein
MKTDQIMKIMPQFHGTEVHIFGVHHAGFDH